MTLPADSDGSEVLAMSELYKKAQSSFVESVRYYVELGVLLTAKKKQSKHREWLPWLAANEQVLGFGRRQAQRFIQAYKTSTSLLKDPSDPLDEQSAALISDKIWGNADKNPEGSDDAQQEDREEEENDAAIPEAKGQSANAALKKAKRALTKGQPRPPVQTQDAIVDENVEMEPCASIFIPPDTTQEIRAKLNALLAEIKALDARIQVNLPGLNGGQAW
jgi:hypothetical protein